MIFTQFGHTNEFDIIEFVQKQNRKFQSCIL